MARGLRLSVCLVVIYMSFVAGSEYCISGFSYRYCSGDKYCCNSDTECCSPTSLEPGVIIGIVIGCLAFVCCIVTVVICACAYQKKGHQGAVVNAYPHGSTTGAITVATVQNPYPGQQYGPPPPAYGNQQFAPPYQIGNPGMTWQPPNQIPQNHPIPPAFPQRNAAYPPE